MNEIKPTKPRAKTLGVRNKMDKNKNNATSQRGAGGADPSPATGENT
jgi:hypothetical protein